MAVGMYIPPPPVRGGGGFESRGEFPPDAKPLRGEKLPPMIPPPYRGGFSNFEGGSGGGGDCQNLKNGGLPPVRGGGLPYRSGGIYHPARRRRKILALL